MQVSKNLRLAFSGDQIQIVHEYKAAAQLIRGSPKNLLKVA
jgi:hypothetical protein